MNPREEAQSIINNLREQGRGDVVDNLYRLIWKEYVKEDMYGFVEQNSDKEWCAIIEGMTDAIIDLGAETFVFEGNYDCNLDYWTNIENAIRY